MVGPMVSIYSAARVVLREIDRLASDRANFSFGTTLSGLTYLRRMESWKQVGYRIEIVYLRLDSVDLEAIRISTLNGAMYEGRQASIGSIEAGKNADLVVIKGNPSRDIREIENTEIVFKDGSGYGSENLLR
jgi:imidazolonepropionase-like amidohydrolase